MYVDPSHLVAYTIGFVGFNCTSSHPKALHQQPQKRVWFLSDLQGPRRKHTPSTAPGLDADTSSTITEGLHPWSHKVLSPLFWGPSLRHRAAGRRLQETMIYLESDLNQRPANRLTSADQGLLGTRYRTPFKYSRPLEYSRPLSFQQMNCFYIYLSLCYTWKLDITIPSFDFYLRIYPKVSISWNNERSAGIRFTGLLASGRLHPPLHPCPRSLIEPADAAVMILELLSLSTG
jgi:hypothetical protein